MSEKKYSLDESLKIAVDFHTKGDIDNAKGIYEKILDVKPDHLLALGNLGIIFSQQKKFKNAIDIFEKVIKIEPKYAEAYNNLGNVLFETSELDKSLNCYKKAVKINPKFSDAFNNLGNVYLKKNEIDKAIQSYESAISLASGLNRDKPYYNLGNIFREKGNIDQSIKFYNKAIEINPNSVDSYVNLSISYEKKGDLKKAVGCCEIALNIDSKNITALNNLGKYHQEMGECDLSAEYLKKAIEINPENLRSRWLLMNIFPIVYKDLEEITFFRNHFEEKLNEIENLVKQKIIYNKEHIISALTSCTNFYLHYQDTDITHLQKKYGAIVNKLTKYIYPQYHLEKLINEKPKKIKVGYVSSFLCEHVITKLFKNWIIKLNKSLFETYVYHTGFVNDNITKLIKENCFNFYNETKDIDKTIERINNDNLDVLIFFEIGMDPKMQILGSLKLARFQCCAYGVPVTSGLRNIDYFLSSEIMETDFSENQYSEKLIKLPDLGVDYDEPQVSNIVDFNYKKEDQKIIFLCLQSSYKLLPQHDHIYFDIIKKNSNCKFWFIGTKNDFISKKFKERIELICNKRKLSINDFFIFYPKMSYENYLNLIYKSDIILDSFDWSGLNTSIDSLNLNKPVVTLPGNSMRSRHSYGILKILKIEELISSSKTQYIDIAVKLSEDPSFLEKINKKIQLNKKKLFNNHKTIEFLENFLLSLFKKNN
tara:strand:- start:15 stop:2141 length:2127 start_codon:yes stop_codon:yes gene_type:complete